MGAVRVCIDGVCVCVPTCTYILVVDQQEKRKTVLTSA